MDADADAGDSLVPIVVNRALAQYTLSEWANAVPMCTMNAKHLKHTTHDTTRYDTHTEYDGTVAVLLLFVENKA